MTTSLLKTQAAGILALGLALALLLSYTPAQAQSEVTGTLSSGATATGSTATGTVSGGTGNTISGTVVGATECSDGIDNDNDSDIDFPADEHCENAGDNQEEKDASNGGGGGGGGGSRSSNNNNNDDDGEVLGVDTTGVGGGGDIYTPGVPNTGAGGDTAMTLTTLILSLLAFAGGGVALWRYRH